MLKTDTIRHNHKEFKRMEKSLNDMVNNMNIEDNQNKENNVNKIVNGHGAINENVNEKLNEKVNENIKVKPDKVKNKDDIVIISNSRLKELLKNCDAKSRVSKEVHYKVNQYFIENIIKEVIKIIVIEFGKLILPDCIKSIEGEKILPVTKFSEIFSKQIKEKDPNFKPTKEKDNILKIQIYCENILMNNLKKAQNCKLHGNRQTLLLADWVLATEY